MRTITIALMAFGATLAGASAQAATVQITSVIANWTNAENSAADYNGLGKEMTTIDNLSDSAVVSWGIPVVKRVDSNGQDRFFEDSTGPQSDYIFDEYASGNQVGPFQLGDFTHNNRPVFYKVLESVILDLTVNVMFEGHALTFRRTIDFNHHETINPESCPYTDESDNANGCPDLVSIVPSDPQSINLPEGALTFTLLGFKSDDGLDPVYSFITTENKANTAPLLAEFDFEPNTPPAVPLPAAGWMLIAGIGGLVAMKRRQKARV